MSQQKEFEVKISKTEKGYRALSPVFPNCRGFGKTQAGALKSLSKSIGDFIGKMVEKNMNDTMNSQSYTDIINDPINKGNDIKRLYDLRKTDKKNIKFNINLPEFNMPKSKLSDFEMLSQMDMLIESSDDDSDDLSETIMDTLFGFPINLN